MMGFFFIFYLNIFGQNSNQADSLELIYTSGTFVEQDKLKILESLAKNSADPEKNLIFSNILIETARALDSSRYLFIGYLYRGYAYKSKGDFIEAMDSFILAAKLIKIIKLAWLW